MTLCLRRPAALSAGLLLAGVLLAGCGDDSSDGSGDPSTPASSSSSTSSDEPGGSGDEPSTSDGSAAGPAGDVPDGCELVPADLVQETLGVDPGDSATEPSNVSGPDTCTYGDIYMAVQVSTDPDTYFSADVFSVDSVPDSEPAPDPADRGYVAVGSFVLVKGSVGVFVTASGAPDTTIEQWGQLADAVADKLP